MGKKWFWIAGLVLAVAVAGLAGCGSPATEKSNFNMIFRYGVMARNELDTFQGIYTKDMIADPSITVPLSLTEEELDSIYRKMVEIGFFSYPDEFSVSVAPGESIGMVTPHMSYYFKVEYDSQTKELWWDEEIVEIGYEDEKAGNLRSLIELIRSIIGSKEEYRQLPEPGGGYM